MPDPDGYTLTDDDRRTYAEIELRLKYSPRTPPPWPPAKRHFDAPLYDQEAENRLMGAIRQRAIEQTQRRYRRLVWTISMTFFLGIGVLLGLAIANETYLEIYHSWILSCYHSLRSWFQNLEASWRPRTMSS